MAGGSGGVGNYRGLLIPATGGVGGDGVGAASTVTGGADDDIIEVAGGGGRAVGGSGAAGTVSAGPGNDRITATTRTLQALRKDVLPKQAGAGVASSGQLDGGGGRGHPASSPPLGDFPTGKTLGSWRAEDSTIPEPTQNFLITLEWIGRAENLLIAGPSGTGKSHFTEGLAQAAIE